MRHGTTNRRQRNRGHGGNGHRRGGQQRAQVFDSNGPDVRIRGTAHQVAEKYVVLAKDAAAAGDRVLAESYLQYAEHYQRIINSWGDNVQHDRSRQNDFGDAEDGAEESTGSVVPQRQSSREDLGLPASILGGSPKAENKQETDTRTTEMSTN